MEQSAEHSTGDGTFDEGRLAEMTVKVNILRGVTRGADLDAVLSRTVAVLEGVDGRSTARGWLNQMDHPGEIFGLARQGVYTVRLDADFFRTALITQIQEFLALDEDQRATYIQQLKDTQAQR